MLRYCSGHQADMDPASFYESSLRVGETRCKGCNGRARLERRRRDPLKWLHWKTGRAERGRGATEAPSMTDVEAIVKRFGNTSAFLNGTGPLCIVRYDPDIALSCCPWNGVLVTAEQAQRLPR